ncbi:hypothetical protein K435DRAFT_861815 [Dendrothele bispora CBS 962.96]|uniref:Uncharacterized protein n=1 Tax=Dendrothele bispora (strain CBS 962.96) TaxID=1314807 RepID=A0A4S8LUV6_DENBC|nr:hypothetical protein K435DRAFT_861815 [Dendrothele bispora CBS 962.96]
MDELVETIAVSPGLKSLALFSVEIEEDNHLGSRDPQERLGRTGVGPNQSKLRTDLSSLSLFMKDQKPTWLMDWLLGPESSYSLAHLNKFSLIADKTDQLSIVNRVASTSQCLQEMNVTLGFGGIEENYLDTPAQDLSSPYNVDFGFFLSSEFQSSSQAVIDWWCNSLEQSGPNLKLETLNMYVLVEAEDLDFEDFSLGWQRLDGILAGSLRQGDENNGVSLILWIKLMEDAEEEEEEEFQAQTISREILGKLEDAFPMVKAKGMLQVCQMTGQVLIGKENLVDDSDTDCIGGHLFVPVHDEF